MGLTLVLKLPLDSLFDEESPFLLFFGAVVVAAWLGGLTLGFCNRSRCPDERLFLFVPNPFAPD
jgi:hypothetical protein